MLEINTYIFYSLFLLFCVVFSYKIKARKKVIKANSDIDFARFEVYFLIFIYTFFVGLRYNVGYDYSGYTGWFKELKNTGIFPVDNDIGFVWLNEFLVNYGFESYSLFIVIAFLQILFLLLFLKRLSLLRSWYFYFYFTSLLFFVSMNAMRQTLAFLIFAYSIQIFYEKKYCKTFFLALFALSIHKTAIMVFVLLPFLKFEWFRNVKIQIGLLILSVFVLPSFFAILLNYVTPLVNVLGYGYYIDNLDYMKEITDENKAGDGLSIFLFFFVDLFIILFYDKLKSSFANYNFIQFYNLYFIGLILSRIFADNFILARIADYFIFFRVVTLSFLMYYIFTISSKKTTGKLIKPIAVIICLGMLLFYYKAIYNNAAGIAPFQFYFDHD
jgi:hypothetical protein